jgi:hypothetical protein
VHHLWALLLVPKGPTLAEDKTVQRPAFTPDTLLSRRCGVCGGDMVSPLRGLRFEDAPFPALPMRGGAKVRGPT